MRLIPLLLAFGFLSVACSSKKLKPVDEKLDVKAKMGDTEIGINKEGEAVSQESTAIEDELRKLSWQNYENERKLNFERDELVRCRRDLADPRLQGSKKLAPIPETELGRDHSRVEEKLGITESGRIKVVKREGLEQRLEQERRFQESLGKSLKIVSELRSECDRELGYVRVQNGLPSERYEAKGSYGPGGVFVVTRPAERSLDDAFRIRDSEAAKARGQLEKKTAPGEEE